MSPASTQDVALGDRAETLTLRPSPLVVVDEQVGGDLDFHVTPVPASRRGKKGVLIYLEPDMAKALKRLAVDQDTTIQALGV